MRADRRRVSCEERLRRMAASRLGAGELRQEVMAELERTIGIDGWSWSLTDPDSLVGWSAVTSATQRAAPDEPLGPDPARDQLEGWAARRALAHAEQPAMAAAAAGSGRARSKSERLRDHGLSDVLLWACRDAHGCWGWLKAFRMADRPPFQPDDVALLARLSETFGNALRERVAEPGRAGAERGAPAVLMLDGRLRLVGWSESASACLGALSGPGAGGTPALPAVIFAVAGLAIAPAPDAHGGVAITIRAAEPAEVATLLYRVFALTPRERQLAALAAGGLTTRDIATGLHLSPHTVKDHFKSIFSKTGVHSRRELAVALGGAPPAELHPLGVPDLHARPPESPRPAAIRR